MSLILIYLSTAISFLVSTLYAARTWSYRRSYLHRLVFVIEVGYAMWAFSLISTMAVDDMQFKIFMTHLRMLALPLIFPAWLLLVAALFFSELSAKFRRWWRWIFLFPVLVIGANAAGLMGVPGVAPLFYSDFHELPAFQGLVGFTRGPLIRATFVYSALCIVLAFSIAAYAAIVLRGARRRYATALVAVSLWPLVLEAGILLASPDMPWRQLKVMGLWPFILAIHYAATRVDVFEITSLAQQRVFEGLPGPVVILNTRSEYWGSNMAAEKILGLQKRWRGRPAQEIPVLAEILASDGKYQSEGFSYQVLKHTLESQHGENRAHILQLNDVTELEESNKVLRELNEEILRMHRFNKRVQTVLAHDLTGALVGTQMLLKDAVRQISGDEAGRSQSSLGKVHEAHQVSLELLRNILTWSFEEESKGGVELGARIKAVVRHLVPQMLQRNVDLGVQLPEQEVWLWGSARVVDAIVRNLLSNAIKFSPDKAQVLIAARTEGAFAVLMIQDEGAGISSDLLARLSDSGESVSSEDGFGVGLKFTRDFVQQMDGILSFEVNSPVGTRVVVKLPLFVRA